MKDNKKIAPLLLALLSSLFSIALIFLPIHIPLGFMAGILTIAIILPQFLYFFLAKKNDIEKIEPEISHQADCSLEELKILELKEEVSSHIKMEEESCKEIHELALRSHIFSPIFKELCTSISKNLSATTEPLSDELFKIKKDISSFLHHVSQYEDEVKNHKMLNRVSSECSNIQADMQMLDTNIREVFGNVEENIIDLQVVNTKIGTIAKAITEVSEKIRILSFNASIEAARAGKAGSGFRVIANEIKDLSALTDTHLSQIWDTLKDTQGVFDTIRRTIKENTENMYEVLTERQSGLSSFIEVLKGYFNNFADLFDSVNEVINSLSHSMDKIAPVVQMHEITSQEVGNMEIVIQDISKDISTVYDTLPNAKPLLSDQFTLNEQAKQVSKKVRTRLTTERELEALKKAISKVAPDAKIDLGMTTKAIELF